MTFEVAAEKLNALEAQLSAYSHAMGLLNCDGETAAPKNSAAGRGRTTGILSEAYYKLFVNDETKEILETVLAGSKEEQPILCRRA